MVVGIIFPFLPSEMVILNMAEVSAVQARQGVKPQRSQRGTHHATTRYRI